MYCVGVVINKKRYIKGAVTTSLHMECENLLSSSFLETCYVSTYITSDLFQDNIYTGLINKHQNSNFLNTTKFYDLR